MEFQPAGFGGGIVLDAVEQGDVQPLGTGADGPLAATVDEGH
ncbi:hypothetical protein [Streptosporangium sp. NPDC050280]